MRIAVFSDIHGNLEALDAVIADMQKRKVDQRVCLGDIVGYGADPDACIDRVRQTSDMVVLGNHDLAVFRPEMRSSMSEHARAAIDWTIPRLGPDDVEFLQSLPASVSKDDRHFVHSSPGNPYDWIYIMDRILARLYADSFRERLCFIGHVHRPAVHPMKANTGTDRLSEYNAVDRFIINVGSVGQPRDRDPRACYGLLDTVAGSYETIRVEYDIARAARKIITAGYDRYLADRLHQGK
jgi:diadenosine tetraphosphatase ApaH/serine/threonine PP2A family protein phosphatase